MHIVGDRYEGSGAPEIFLSFETPDEAQTLCGFLRLRLPNCAVTLTPDDSDSTQNGCIYTPLQNSTECSAPLNPGILQYNPPRSSASDTSLPRAGAADVPTNATVATEGAIEAQQRLRAEERKAAVTAAANSSEVVCAFPELQGCALIRELHVYGKLVVAEATPVEPSDTDTEATEEQEQAQQKRVQQHLDRCGHGTGNTVEDISSNDKATDKSSTQSQHGGFGRRLMARAEEIAMEAVSSQ